MRNFAKALAPVFVVGTLMVITASQARAADRPTIVVVKLFPIEGREDEAQARLAKLVKFVPVNNPGVTFRLHRSTKKPVVFLLYETYPSQAALDSQPKTVLPAFSKEFGATPEGLYTKPNEVELYRMKSDE
jgi:quinol monooxygenase YgiN